MNDDAIYGLIAKAMEITKINELLKYSYIISKQISKDRLDLSIQTKQLKKWLQDNELIRQLSLRYSITDTQDAYHYFSPDVGEDDVYEYMVDLEILMQSINIYILDMLSDISAILNVENINIFNLSEK